MSENDTAIMAISRAELALQEASDIHEIIDLRDKAAAMQVFADAKGFEEAAEKAKVFQLKAERKAGKWLEENIDHGGNPKGHHVLLKDVDVSPKESIRWQLQASVPEEVFNEWVEDCQESGKEISASALRELAKEEKKKELKKETVEEQAPIPEPSYVVNYGDVWRLGNHRVMCGDSFSQSDINKLLNNLEVDALISDPPYGIAYRPDWNKWDGSESDFNPVIGDDQEFDPEPFLHYPTVALFGANYFSNRLPVGGWICWDKRLDAVKDAMFGSPFELAWYRSENTTKKSIMIRVLHGGVVNADSSNGNNEKRYHTTQKPIEVMKQVIEQLTRSGDRILDPFSGSGSTLLACNEVGRSCMAMEIDPEYVSIIIQRWEEKTGGKPERINS